MSTRGRPRQEGPWPREKRDPKEQGIKDSHNLIFQVHSQGVFFPWHLRAQASPPFVRTFFYLSSQGRPLKASSMKVQEDILMGNGECILRHPGP